MKIKESTTGPRCSNAEEPEHHHRHRLCAGESPPPIRALIVEQLDRRDQASGPATRRRDAGAAHQVETLMLESQQLRRGVIALVRAASDKEVAASPALQALRDQVVGLEHVQVLAE